MAITPVPRADFEARFPEFTSPTLDVYYLPNQNIYDCYFNKAYIVANTCDAESILLVIAHLITIDSKTSTSSLKDKASQGVDGVSVSYFGATDKSESNLFFDSTKYGQRFLQINRHNHGGFFV